VDSVEHGCEDGLERYAMRTLPAQDTNCQQFWQTFVDDRLESTGGTVNYSGIFLIVRAVAPL